MGDSFKKLTDLIVEGKLKSGTPRFDPSSVSSVELGSDFVIFILRSGRYLVTFRDLTLDEARIAYHHYSGSVKDTVVNDRRYGESAAEQVPDIGLPCDDPGDVKDIAGNNLRYVEHEAEQETDKGLLAAYFYTPPDWVIVNRFKLSVYIILIVFALVGAVLFIHYLNDLPVTNDKNEAYSIALTDTSLKQFIAGRDVSIETLSYEYYDPEQGRYVKDRSNYMSVGLQAWIFKNDIWPGQNFTYRKPVEIGTFSIIVDLHNDTVIRSSHSVMPW